MLRAGQVPSVRRRAPVSLAIEALSGHTATRIVPHGWSLEADIREEMLALSELVALRKVS